MIESGIKIGDLVVIDTEAELQACDIAVVEIGSSFILRRALEVTKGIVIGKVVMRLMIF